VGLQRGAGEVVGNLVGFADAAAGQHPPLPVRPGLPLPPTDAGLYGLRVCSVMTGCGQLLGLVRGDPGTQQGGIAVGGIQERGETGRCVPLAVLGFLEQMDDGDGGFSSQRRRR
jgi:hypothetical protein